MQRRPEFQHYPLNKQQLSDLTQERQVLDKDIRDNLVEIRMLNNKMAKNDYELTYLHRLQQREKVLDSKRKQMDEILRTHHYLQEQVNINKQNEQQFRSTLAHQYKNVIEEKKARADQQRRRKIQQEQAIVQHNQRLLEAEHERKRREQFENRRAVQEELAHKQMIKQRQRQDKQREKYEYNQKVALRNSLQTQKQAVYKQYYNQFTENQNRLQNVYQDKTAPHIQEKQKMMQDFIRKEQEEFAQQQNRIQEERTLKAYRQKQMLRSYLQNQIEEKERRKSLDSEQRRTFNQQLSQYQMTQKQYDQYEKQRKREQQKHYNEDLGSQIKMRSSFTNQSVNPAHKIHNPITNPIDFKMGITNPYIINQYEDTKQRYVGDRDLKLRNLALVGTNSLTSH